MCHGGDIRDLAKLGYRLNFKSASLVGNTEAYGYPSKIFASSAK